MPDQLFTKTITIAAPTQKVWAALTEPTLMQQWMTETTIDIITDWQVGSPIVIQGDWYKTGFKNTGTVLAYDREQLLSYTHLSSLSRLPDVPESYTVYEFRLAPGNDGTILTLRLSGFPTETIYKHLAFYWNVVLELLKKFIENQ